MSISGGGNTYAGRIRENDCTGVFRTGEAERSSYQELRTSRNPDKFGTLYGRIDEKERKIADEIDSLIDFKLKVSGEINEIEDERYVELLYKRYIQNESWDAISVDMQYNRKYIIQLHGCALKEFQNKFDDMLAESNPI